MKKLAPLVAALVIVLLGALITPSSDNAKDKVKTESTTTTQPEDTPSTTDSSSGSSTTTTTEDSTTTSTPSDDDAEECGEGIFGSLNCTTPAPDPGDADDGPLDLGKPCVVQLDRLDYNFYHDGKIAVENFREPFKGDINTEEGLNQFIKGALQLACEDPVAMASYASNTVLKDQKLTVEQQNHLVLKYLDHVDLWQRHLDKLTERWNSAVLVRVVNNDGRPAETDAQRHVGGKRPPELFIEDLKGSCTQIVEIWMEGEVDQLCVQCFQFVRRTPKSPPAIPVTPEEPSTPRPPCTTCTTTTTRPRGNPTTTTAPPTPTTTTTRPTTPTTRPVVLCPEGPNAGKPAPNGDLSQCLKSTGGGTPGD
jgi:hypothetical protein